jgi:outer membrane protein insertion porin family
MKPFQHIFVVLLLSGFFVSILRSAQAQDASPANIAAQPAPSTGDGTGASPDSPAADFVIRAIKVEGTQRIEPETVRSYLTIAAGDRYDPAKVDQSLKVLFATGLFADVVITTEGTDLVVRVAENPIINRVVFEGNDAIKNDDLEDEVELRARVVYTRARVQADVQRIVELYRRKGRFSATVEPKVVLLPQNRVDLIFEINEGEVTGVRSINFIGNEAFSDGELRGAIATSESRWWKFFGSNDNYDPDRLAYDREQLRRFYLSRGYADFRVESAVAELTRDRDKFFITFTVSEGEKYKIGQVGVTTEFKSLDEKKLLELVSLREGDIYNVELIDTTVDDITFAAGSQGYAFVDVSPRVTRHEDKRLIDLDFVVKEGPRVYVERIDIEGNTRTLDRVIRREFRLAEGDAFNRVLLERSKDRIKALGFFKEVEVSEEQGSLPDRTVITATVQEQPTGELSVGAGFSSAENFIAELSVTERNLLGRGQFLRFRVQFSGRGNQIDVRFTEPYFLDRHIAAGIDLFRIEADYQDEAGFDSLSTGFGLRTGFPLSEYSSLGLTYSFRADKISNVFFLNTSPVVQQQALRGQEISSIIGYRYSIDKRDDPLKPTKGWTFEFGQEFSGVGGATRYLRSDFKASYYYQIAEDFIASARVATGYIKGLFGQDVQLNDRFFRGGDDFRGFEDAGLGPRDTNFGDALGGNFYSIATFELTVPLGLPDEFGITAALFSDVGTLAFTDDEEVFAGGTQLTNIRDEFALRATVGVSVFWQSPFGPIRLDFGQALLKEPYDRTEFFRFSTATRF